MKKFLYKFLIVLLATGLLTPTWLNNIWSPTKAEAAAPVVTAANITVLGVATGTGGTFKIGDTVTGQFDDSGNGPADQAASVTIDFSQFGGGILAASVTVPGSYVWQASYTIAAGAGAVDSPLADIIVAATNSDGTAILEDTEDHSVDNIAPSSLGLGSVVVVNNNAVNNSTVGIDDKVSFAIGSLDVSDGATWTVNLASPNNLTGESALASGNTSLPAIENNLIGSKRFPVTGTDDAGNTTTIINGTNLITVDTLRPYLTGASTETTNSILVDFSETINSGSVSTGDFAISNPVRPVVTASRIANTRVKLQTTSAFSPSATPTIAITSDGGAGIYDSNGNGVNIGSSIVASDGVKPQVGPDVEDLVYTEGKNDRDESLAVTFSEAIPTVGSTGDYTVVYDPDGDFSDATDQRNVAVTSVSNPDNNQTVGLSIANQSGELDYNGRFQVTVNTSNIHDAGGNGVDPFANVAQSDTVSVFDSSTPALLTAGLDPNSGLHRGVGSTITVYTTTDDGSSDQNLSTFSGTINGNPLNFAYDAGDSRYEANYVIAEGDADQIGLEALNISLQDRADNVSNILSTSGNSLNVDANTPAVPNISDPISAEIINAGSRAISGTAEIDSVVTIYTDPNNDGDKSDGVVVGSSTAAGGNFMISVPLVQNADNNFLVTSTDAAGNESAPSDVATITEDSITPIVSVNFPNGGDLLSAGVSVGITWTLATDDHLVIDPIGLYYSTDNGSNYSLISSNEANDGSYSWIVPAVNSDQILVKVAATDEAENVGEDTSNTVFSIDDSLPSSEVSVNLQGQTYGPNTWDQSPISGNISGTASDFPAGISGVTLTVIDPNGLYWNGSGWQGVPATVDATGTTSWLYGFDKANLVVNNGVYTIASRATDNLGKIESTGTGTFVWDNQNPTASIINPNVNTKWQQGNKTITWTASDAHFGGQPVMLEYSPDGGSSWTTIISATENDGSYVWNIPIGTNTNAAQVRLTATDSAGNSTVATSPLFTIDSTQPNVSITAPASSLVMGSVTLSASVNDPTPPTTPTGISYVRFSYRLVGTTSWTNLPQITAAPYDYSWDTTSVTDGSYEIRATAADLATNSRTTVAPYTVITVDNTAPTVTVTMDDAALNIGDTALVTFTFSEAPTDFDAVDVDLTNANGTIGAIDTSNPLVQTTTFTPTNDMTDAINIITVGTAWTDTAGNAGVGDSSDNYTIDTTAPTVTVTMDDAALNIGDTALVTFTFSETPVGFTTADVTADNGSIGTIDASNPLIQTATFTPTNDMTDATNAITVGTNWTDAALNTGVGDDSPNYAIDTLAPATPVINIVATDDIINAAERTATVTVTGTNESGSTVTLNGNAVEVDTATTWHYVLIAVAIDAFDQGLETLTAIATDTAGNPNTENRTRNITVDTTAPTISADPVAGDYLEAQSVVLSSADATSGLDKIYYTTDGIDPDNTDTEYTAPIMVTSDTTIKAIAYDKAGNSSGILTAAYGIAPMISNQASALPSTTVVIITWTTDFDATSRVIYDTVSHSDSSIVGYPHNSLSYYGYAFSTIEDSSAVALHSVSLVGLTPGTTYYYRTVSHGSPEAVSGEKSFTTVFASLPVTIATTSTPTPSVTQPATPSTTITPQVTTPTVTTPTEEGKIKGEETTTEQTAEKINWTPWIILFILIILAGAATGGYFYWFGREEDEEIITKEVVEKGKKPAEKKTDKKASNKKNKRW